MPVRNLTEPKLIVWPRLERWLSTSAVGTYLVQVRVCFISREFPPGSHVGGVGRATGHLAQSLVARGHDVTVITQKRSDAKAVDPPFRLVRWSESERPRGLYYRHRVAGRWDAAHKVALSELAFRAAESVAAAVGAFDVVDTWMWGAEAVRYPRHRALGPLLVRLSSPDFEIRRQYGEPDRPDLDRLDAACLAHADVIAAISRENLCRIEERFTVDRTRVVETPLGIPADFRPADAHKREHEILFVGRLEPRKGVQDLIEALPTILMADRRVSVRIVWSTTGLAPDGMSYEEYFRRRVPKRLQSRVRFEGRLSDDELIQAHRRARVAVVPSRYESFGLVVLEALVHGTPVVATRVGGIPEIMDDRMGRLVAPASPEALAEALIELLADPGRAADLGAAGAEHVRESFSVETMTDRTLMAYKRLLAERS